ncbi:MAG: hypothetical protein ABI744_02010 [Chloroflexota bacterium]
MCEDTQTQGSGNRSIGTLSGSIRSGRILIGIEAAAGPSGTFAIAYIDSSGLHEIPSIADWTTAHPTWETQNTIVFDSERAGDRNLFRADISDSSVTQITSTFRVGEEKAAVLGDGRLVHDEYSCAEMSDFGLHITSADGSSDMQLTPTQAVGNPAFDTSPAVSPDGHTIVFVRNVDDNVGALFTIDAAGGDVVRLTPDSRGVEYPRWSPDGNTILFDQTPSGGSSDVWTVPAAGGDAKQVTHSAGGALRWEADWSPDGTQIVLKYYEPGWRYNALHIADADGSNETVLWTGDYSTAETPHWDP